MTDRHAPSRSVNSMFGAAKILEPIRSDAPKPEPWHDLAWRFRDAVGELRFAEMWLGNSFSRSRLFAAKRPKAGAEPEALESGPAVELMEALAGGIGGIQEILRQFGTYLMVPGVGFLIGEPTEAGGPEWIIRSAEEIRLRPAPKGRGRAGTERVFQVQEGERASQWRDLEPDTIVVKVLRPHPRRHWEPDSPTRSSLPILNELDLLTQHVAATATSRLAGAGVQAFPAEMTFDDSWEKFIAEWTDAVTKPIKNRELAAAYVPFPLRMPGNMIQWFKDGLIRYNTPFDEQAMRLREEAIQRLGNSMDVPRPVLTGESRNHWGDWQVEESGLKIHVEPGLALIADAFTVGYLEPGLESLASEDQEARRDIERFREQNPDGDIIVWYDTSDLRVRPDRTKDSQALYNAWELDGDTWRHEAGLSEGSSADPNDPETVKRIAFHLLQFESQVPLAIDMLTTGSLTPPALQTPPEPDDGEDEQVDEDVDDDGGDGRELPDTRDDEPDENEGAPEQEASAIPAQAIVAACDGIVYRALERAGNKYARLMKRAEHAPCDLPPADLYLCDDDNYHLRMQVMMQGADAKLLDGAWDRVVAVADMLDEDAEPLRDTLDAYVRLLVRTKQPHSWDRLAHALGMCPSRNGDAA